MIIVDKDSELVTCSCGTKFVIEPKDRKTLYSSPHCFYVVYECPNCKTMNYGVYFVGENNSVSKVVDIEKEKEDEKDNNE